MKPLYYLYQDEYENHPNGAFKGAYLSKNAVLKETPCEYGGSPILHVRNPEGLFVTTTASNYFKSEAEAWEHIRGALLVDMIENNRKISKCVEDNRNIEQFLQTIPTIF